MSQLHEANTKSVIKKARVLETGELISMLLYYKLIYRAEAKRNQTHIYQMLDFAANNINL